MIDMEVNHCHLVNEVLGGHKEADEQAFASLGILSERLERLTQYGGAFAALDFSPAVKELMTRENALPIA